MDMQVTKNWSARAYCNNRAFTPSLQGRAAEIRRAWSPDELERRRQEGERRQQYLLSAVLLPFNRSDLPAVEFAK